MRLRRALPGCCLVAMLAGCSNTVQTSSGASYLAARPEFHPPAGAGVDRAVYDAANAEPELKFPARIGLARIERARLTAIPPAEGDKWLELVRDSGPAYGEFVPVSPLVAEMTVNATGASAYDVIDKIRIGAARQHVDAVLVYEVSASSSDKATALSVADLTVIGAFLIPSRDVAGHATANAILIDVRNGYPYGTATSTAERTGFTTNNGSTSRARDLADQAGTDAVGKLTLDVATMMARLKSELDTRELNRLRAAQPGPPGKGGHG